MNDWRFELARSLDLTRIAELTQARNRQLQLALNRAGSFSFSMPLDDPLASEIAEVETCVIAYFQGAAFWSGPVWNTAMQVGANSALLNVGCVGWLQGLDRRETRPAWNNNAPFVYQSVDAGAIALDLLMRSNQDATDAGAPNFLFPGFADATQARDRTYQPWSNILQSILELTSAESGFDISVHPTERKLNAHERLSENLGVTFHLGANVQSVEVQTDASRTANYFTAYGPAGSAVSLDSTSLARIGLFSEAQSLSDVINLQALQIFAAAEVGLRGWPLPIVTFTPMPYSPSHPERPRPIKDYNVGDVVYLHAQRGRMDIRRQAIRLFGFTIGFQGDSETVTGVQGTYAS